jgi:tRNA dimethylallyltransferase
MTEIPEKRTVYILLGPTAAGKSAAGLEVAERIGAEIISADSMQVYRGMDIGTAKPTEADRARVPHHLLDIRDPWEPFSTAEYVALADEAIREITARGNRPLFVGGTALYVKSLLSGIFDGPSADWDFRKQVRAEAERIGVAALHRRLAEIDPEAAGRIHPNDLRRIERALEIYEKTGTEPSKLRQQWSSDNLRYEAKVAGLDLPRALLHERINRRVDAMMAAGWLEEVRRLLEDPRGLGREASQALGYKELAAVVRGEAEVAEAVEKIKARTRQFAKRQMTWFRGFGDIVRWVRAERDKGTADIAREVLLALGFDLQTAEKKGDGKD